MPFQLSFLFRSATKVTRSILSRHRPLRRKVYPLVSKTRRVHTNRGSDAELLEIWLTLRRQWFPHRSDLDSYVVCWSNRPQKRTLATCSILKRKVRVARELNTADCQKWLSPLLYHEMCHAILGESVEDRSGRMQWHGPAFKRLEARNPEVALLDRWINEGGWGRAVRSDRSRRAHQKRRAAA